MWSIRTGHVLIRTVGGERSSEVVCRLRDRERVGGGGERRKEWEREVAEIPGTRERERERERKGKFAHLSNA